MSRACSTNGEKTIACRILVGKPEGKRLLGKCWRWLYGNVMMDLKRDGVLWTGLIWLGMWTNGGLFWTRHCTFGFHEILGHSWVTGQLAASQENLSSIKLVRELVSQLTSILHTWQPIISVRNAACSLHPVHIPHLLVSPYKLEECPWPPEYVASPRTLQEVNIKFSSPVLFTMLSLFCMELNCRVAEMMQKGFGQEWHGLICCSSFVARRGRSKVRRTTGRELNP
jgi:hypothetical protein